MTVSVNFMNNGLWHYVLLVIVLVVRWTLVDRIVVIYVWHSLDKLTLELALVRIIQGDLG